MNTKLSCIEIIQLRDIVQHFYDQNLQELYATLISQIQQLDEQFFIKKIIVYPISA